MDPVDFQLEFLSSRNQPWRRTAMSKATRAGFHRALEHGELAVARMFWGIYGLRRKPYRLRLAGNVIAANRRAGNNPQPPFERVFTVRVWRELVRSPGTFAPRLDAGLAEALAVADTDEAAIQRLQTVPAPRSLDGSPLSMQLLAICTRRRDARPVHYDPCPALPARWSTSNDQHQS